ncbi:MAG: peroxiredoxin [Pseudoxanthomonas suwonensis]|nr:peroxiredoxin [Pseudoxanthomonas suwonensis]
MPIQIGERLPEAVLQYIGEGVENVDTTHLFEGKRMVLFAVPGAFTPTCSEAHLPGYVRHYDDFAQRGIEVACISVNDPFVMHAWGDSQGVPAGLRMLADGNGDFTRALGLQMDASAYGMGLRSKRYAIYVEDGMVRALFVESPGEFRVSSAEHVLQQLGDTRDR